MAEERLKLAVFIDFDNIQIGVKDTLGKDFDVSVVLEALKERGEVVSKTAYADWARAGDYGRQMTQHAVQMVQRNVTPRGDKNGADINLALDALEMAFTRDHINSFAIVGGDSDFIALVEKLKQYDKHVFVVGGRQFTSGILQRNCHEFIAYENLIEAATGGDGSRAARTTRSTGRGTSEIKPLASAVPNIQRALKILEEREVAPQLGLLKSTLLQLDATFTERDYGAGSFLEFIRKLEAEKLVQARKTDRGFLVEMVEAEGAREPLPEAAEPVSEAVAEPAAPPESVPPPFIPPPPEAPPEPGLTAEESLALLKRAISTLNEKGPARPIYLRQVRQAMRNADGRFDERQAGFRGLLDLLHQAQREGWLRLHRDRKGVWRVFLIPAEGAPPVPVAPEAVPEPMLEPDIESTAPETDVMWEIVEVPDELQAIEAPPAEPPLEPPLEPVPLIGEPPALVEVEPERKGRKAHAAKRAPRRNQRKTTGRRKPKRAPDLDEAGPLVAS